MISHSCEFPTREFRLALPVTVFGMIGHHVQLNLTFIPLFVFSDCSYERCAWLQYLGKAASSD